MHLAVKVLLRIIPTATWDLGLYGLTRKTGTHVPQWDSKTTLHNLLAQHRYVLDKLPICGCYTSFSTLLYIAVVANITSLFVFISETNSFIYSLLKQPDFSTFSDV